MVVRTVDAISSVGIIYSADNPEIIFGEVKDAGYPHVEWRHHLFLMGGSGNDSDAYNDAGPLQVFLREKDEEMVVPTMGATDQAILARLRTAIDMHAAPLMDFYFEIPRECFLRANPLSNRGDRRELASVIGIPLATADWDELTYLQERYGNISIESNSCITNFGAIRSGEQPVSWMVGHILKHFWLDTRTPGARDMPLYPGLTCEPMGTPRATYADYSNDIRLA